MTLTHTRYSVSNVVLLCTGGLICALTSFVALMACGYNATSMAEARGFFANAFFYAVVLMFPAFLVMLRWSHVGALSMWTLTCCSIAFTFLAKMFDYVSLIMMLLIVALIFTAVDTRSRGVEPLRMLRGGMRRRSL